PDELREVLPQKCLAAGDDEHGPVEPDQFIDDETLGLVGGEFTVRPLASLRVAVRTRQIARGGADPLDGLGRADVAEAVEEPGLGPPDVAGPGAEQAVEDAHAGVSGRAGSAYPHGEKPGVSGV